MFWDLSSSQLVPTVWGLVLLGSLQSPSPLVVVLVSAEQLRGTRQVVCLPSLARVVALSFQLIYLKIAGMLFPTSDFRHPVVTPALLCLSQLLTKVRQGLPIGASPPWG